MKGLSSSTHMAVTEVMEDMAVQVLLFPFFSFRNVLNSVVNVYRSLLELRFIANCVCLFPHQVVPVVMVDEEVMVVGVTVGQVLETVETEDMVRKSESYIIIFLFSFFSLFTYHLVAQSST